jgi:hypothetical protein
MKKIVILFLMMFMISFISACKYTEMDGQEIPSAVGSIVGKQEINMYIDDSFDCGISTKEKKVKLSQSEFEKPTLEVYVNTSLLEEIQNHENPQQRAMEAYSNGEIKVVKKTFMNKLKFGIAGIFSKFYNFFGNVIKRN